MEIYILNKISPDLGVIEGGHQACGGLLYYSAYFSICSNFSLVQSFKKQKDSVRLNGAVSQ